MATVEGENESAITKFSRKLLKDICTKLYVLQGCYREFIAHNTEIASRIESILRFLSYVLPGRFGASEALAELLFSASQLLTLLHDWIYRKEKGIQDYPTASSEEESRIVLWLTVLENVEVFVEVGADRIWGEIGKWAVIVVVQIAKVAMRLFLLFKHKSGIQLNPLTPPLDREMVHQEDKTDDNGKEKVEEQTLWHGKRSSRSVRSLSAVSSDGFRTWKLPAEKQVESGGVRSQVPSDLSTKRLVGETLFVSRPLVHLTSMFVFGQNSWKPWLLSYGTEFSSLCLMGDPSDLNAAEKAELSRRTVLLLFYLLRSPFYDSYSKTKIISFLKYLNTTIPGCSLVIRPLLEYLPTWQKIYFYNWTS